MAGWSSQPPWMQTPFPLDTDPLPRFRPPPLDSDPPHHWMQTPMILLKLAQLLKFKLALILGKIDCNINFLMARKKISQKCLTGCLLSMT